MLTTVTTKLRASWRMLASTSASCIATLKSKLTAWRSALSIAAIVLTMTACSSLTTPFEDRPLIPANLTTKCPPLAADMTEKTGAALVRKIIEISQQYYECAGRHNRLSDALGGE